MFLMCTPLQLMMIIIDMMSCHTKFGHKRFSGSEGIIHTDKDQTHRHMGMVIGGMGFFKFFLKGVYR